MMPISDPRGGFFYPTLTLMDSYHLTYPLPTREKNQNQTVARRKTSDNITILK